MTTKPLEQMTEDELLARIVMRPVERELIALQLVRRLKAGEIFLCHGGASGIGRALARRFAAEGMKVVLADTDQVRMREVEVELAEGGTEVLPVRCDTSLESSVQELAQATLERFGAAAEHFGGETGARAVEHAFEHGVARARAAEFPRVSSIEVPRGPPRSPRTTRLRVISRWIAPTTKSTTVYQRSRARQRRCRRSAGDGR